MPQDKPATGPALDDLTTVEADADPNATAGVTNYGDDSTTTEPNSDEQIAGAEHHADSPDALDSDTHTDDDIAGPAMTDSAFDARHDDDPEAAFPAVEGGDGDVDAFIRQEVLAGTMNVVRARNFRDAAETASQPATGQDAVRSWDAYLAANDPDYTPAASLDADADLDSTLDVTTVDDDTLPYDEDE